MPDPPATASNPPPPEAAMTPSGGLFALRREVPRWVSAVCGIACVLVCLGIWHFLTWNEEPELRRLGPTILPSISETIESFPSLWFGRGLTRNLFASLLRVAQGFGLAILIGVPLGVACGCFPWVNAFFAPLTIFGRNIPVAALIPLTFSFFGIGEFQKVMFIFIAAIAFVVFDTAQSVADVDRRYIDTAYTLGASRWQIILKVLVPLAMPGIFNSLRLLFGLAFGYIMLAELVTLGDNAGGLGHIINVSQRRGNQEHIMLILMIIPAVALAIDRALYWIQCQLFPYQHGGAGILNRAVRYAMRGWDAFKGLFFAPLDYAQVIRNSTPTTAAAVEEKGP